MELGPSRGLTIVGGGRMGTALAVALGHAGVEVTGPLRRGEPVRGDIVLLAVPDREIGNALATVPPEALVGHTAGAMTLDVFGGRPAFSIHPLMTATDSTASFAGATAAIAGNTPAAMRVARDIADALELHAIEVRDEDRASYHAAASIAANFLVTLETMAAAVGAKAGLDRGHLLPLARAALENWGRLGPAALTGPIARGDSDTVDRHRAAVRSAVPEFAEAWEAMASATATIARASQR